MLEVINTHLNIARHPARIKSIERLEEVEEAALCRLTGSFMRPIVELHGLVSYHSEYESEVGIPVRYLYSIAPPKKNSLDGAETTDDEKNDRIAQPLIVRSFQEIPALRDQLVTSRRVDILPFETLNRPNKNHRSFLLDLILL